MSHASAVIYARQSLDRTGEELAVTRQLDLCRKHCAEQGWEVVAEYVDNDKSATSGKVRPRFEAMLAAKPPRIVTWHVDRLVRLSKDLERVIDLGVDVVSLQSGIVDLSHPAGRATAKTLTAWAQYEGEAKAARQRVANDQRAEQGLPYRGHRAFAYEVDGMTVRESEARELRAAASAVIRGRSLSSLVHDLNERGVRTASGKTWRTTTLKAALLSPRAAGLRQHRGEIVGKAAWPAVLDEDTATTVRAILTDPSRSRKGRPQRYLLSGVLTCGKCGGPVTGAFLKDKGPTYRCLGHVSRRAAYVDEVVVGVVVARLARDDAVDLFAREDGSQERMRALQEERVDIRFRLDGLAEAYAARAIDMQALTAGTRRLRERLEVIDAETSAAVGDPTLGEVVSAEDVAATFHALPQETQRQIIDRLLTVELLPVGSGPRFDPTTSLKIQWRTP